MIENMSEVHMESTVNPPSEEPKKGYLCKSIFVQNLLSEIP